MRQQTTTVFMAVATSLVEKFVAVKCGTFMRSVRVSTCMFCAMSCHR